MPERNYLSLDFAFFYRRFPRDTIELKQDLADK